MRQPEIPATTPTSTLTESNHSFNPKALQPSQPSPNRLTIKLPARSPFDMPLRRTRRSQTKSPQNSAASGSEYHDSEPMEEGHSGQVEETDESAWTQTRGGRPVKVKHYFESDGDENPQVASKASSSNGKVPPPDDDGDGSEGQPRPSAKGTRTQNLEGFIVSDDEDRGRYQTRSRDKQKASQSLPSYSKTSSGRISRQPTRYTASSKHDPPVRPRQPVKNDDGYVDEGTEDSSDGSVSLDNAPRTSSDLDADVDAEGEPDPDREGEAELEIEADGKPYALRQRAKINYAIPPPLEETKPPPSKGRLGSRGGAKNAKRGPGWSATGAELSRWMGIPADDSDSDMPLRTPRNNYSDGAFLGTGAMSGGASMLSGDFAAAAAGTPSNLGKIGEAALADADPLGVNQNVTFDEVGGLDDHIHALKEMTLLPLLYPEVFQRFNLTPPRGVLFHGPPGTGKTLLARALAASCRSDGKGISFFMRKGADCLSKWVGEAERQLRLLFEEARNCQPSIIFFDEIDGLAPVRSSKQDQIHASIVSTLLALMDGMDGRGQVIVIGATNRPDAIDPALRRPGRFDREFYFPLPSLDARERILRIMTKTWAGWESEKALENIQALVKLTKGYGGADLRALCTEAALNAIQRRYPQIYQSNDRLLLNPQTIGVTFRDFMISIKKIVPSSARSSSSPASPLPSQLIPLLGSTLEKMKEAVTHVLPVSKKRSVLEEAQWEDENEEGALEREMLMQSMETLRVYRPRLVLYGSPGMGQEYIGAAVLHHLEGYHVQTFDLGTLMVDSARTMEAGIVQLFVEVKRHQPSVIYIPSLSSWCGAVPETARSTLRAMLASLPPTDPVLLLAVVDGPFATLPPDVKQWFGFVRECKVELLSPSDEQREAFFADLITDIKRPPNAFLDGIKRRKRVLEVLPIAPPPEPRQPTAAELARQEETDQRVILALMDRFGPILNELKRKFKRFTKRAKEEYDFGCLSRTTIHQEVGIVESNVTVHDENAIVEVTNETIMQEVYNNTTNGTETQLNGRQAEGPMQTTLQDQVQAHPLPPRLFDMDLEHMHKELYRGKYLTPQDFIEDIQKIVHNAHVCAHEDMDRFHKAQAMFVTAQVNIQGFDPHFKQECERMAGRERKRRGKQREKEKAKADVGQNETYAPGTRRSARHNGQLPELQITDPLQLERRLKRARSGERPSDSPEFNEDKSSRLMPRQQKRVRTILSDDEDHDPVVLDDSSDSQGRLFAVRFANDGEPVRVETLLGSEEQPGPNGSVDMMVVDQSTPQQDPFHPFLLNPIPSHSDKTQAMAISHLLNGDIHAPSNNHTPSLSPAPQLPKPCSPQIPPVSPSQTPVPAADSQAEAEAMLVSPPREPLRSPTPLPDFHVDDELLHTLQQQLKSRTQQLTTEMLEQLRATCLGCVWRHRTEWDRDGLIRELLGVLDNFLNDFAAAASSDFYPSPGVE